MVPKDSPYQTHRRPGQGVEGRPALDRRRRRLVARRPRPPAADAARPGRRHRPEDRSTSCRTTAAATCCRRILGNKIDFATSGAGEFKDQISHGDMRVLATSGRGAASARIGRADPQGGRASTWSSPTGAASWPLPASATRSAQRLIDAFQKMHDTQEWKDALEAKNGWADAFVTGDEFGAFLDGAGQAGRRHARASWGWPEPRRHLRRAARRAGCGRSELAVALLLGLVGVVVLVDASRACTHRVCCGGPGRPPAVPARGRRGCCSSARCSWPWTCCAAATARPRSGEDVDLDRPDRVAHRRPAARRPSSPTSLLIDRARLGDLRRDPVLRRCLGPGQPAPGPRPADLASRSRSGTFYGFYVGLGIHLPAGVLEGCCDGPRPPCWTGSPPRRPR